MHKHHQHTAFTFIERFLHPQPPPAGRLHMWNTHRTQWKREPEALKHSPNLCYYNRTSNNLFTFQSVLVFCVYLFNIICTLVVFFYFKYVLFYLKCVILYFKCVLFCFVFFYFKCVFCVLNVFFYLKCIFLYKNVCYSVLNVVSVLNVCFSVSNVCVYLF